eukprot:1775304-Pyramimonas_sp.AAC.1
MASAPATASYAAPAAASAAAVESPMPKAGQEAPGTPSAGESPGHGPEWSATVSPGQMGPPGKPPAASPKDEAAKVSLGRGRKPKTAADYLDTIKDMWETGDEGCQMFGPQRENSVRSVRRYVDKSKVEHLQAKDDTARLH